MCNGQPATLIGTDGNDILLGTPGNDVIVGLKGNDVIIGKDGGDVICAGSGTDGVERHPGRTRKRLGYQVTGAMTCWQADRERTRPTAEAATMYCSAAMAMTGFSATPVMIRSRAEPAMTRSSEGLATIS